MEACFPANWACFAIPSKSLRRLQLLADTGLRSLKTTSDSSFKPFGDLIHKMNCDGGLLSLWLSSRPLSDALSPGLPLDQLAT
jgi:hypothetical protein